jgi:alanine-glyoxylate transaminase / serine-glyoxylate transaminase / serine-pyruvate transaminase
MTYRPGREFLNVPGPTNIPDRVLGAMHRPAMDFLSPEFVAINKACLSGLRRVLKTTSAEIIAYAATGHGSWEAAITNTCSPGDLLLLPETGNFSESWRRMIENTGLRTESIPSDWNVAIVPSRIGERLKADTNHEIKAVCVVHNETSTGIINDLAGIRAAMNEADHPALLMVDTISSLASMDFRMDEWGVDVAVVGTQKGLMLPVGLGINAVSAKGMKATETASLPRRYFDWRELSPVEGRMRFAGTAPLHMFYALQEGLAMLEEEGLEAVFARHARLGEATRRAVHAWSQSNGLSLFALNEAECSNSVTAVLMPDGVNSEAFRERVLAESKVALGGGLGKLNGKVIRIGHLGDLNEPMLLGALATIELHLQRQGVPHGKGGVAAAVTYLAEN